MLDSLNIAFLAVLCSGFMLEFHSAVYDNYLFKHLQVQKSDSFRMERKKLYPGDSGTSRFSEFISPAEVLLLWFHLYERMICDFTSFSTVFKSY